MSRQKDTKPQGQGQECQNNEPGKTVDQYRDEYEYHSGKLSDINRYIAFAGIGLIWIFTKTDTGAVIPDSLILPSILLAFSLALDMAQYLYCTIIWYCHFNKNEKKKLPEATKFKHSKAWNWPTWVLWGLKIACVFVAYGFIIDFLIATLIVNK